MMGVLNSPGPPKTDLDCRTLYRVSGGVGVNTAIIHLLLPLPTCILHRILWLRIQQWALASLEAPWVR